ncbi:MAG TPA: hypothetical protein VFJ51_13460, partial [Nitrososphaeraceae archaeon]|nr:hypothetical protein [Nitrososphaeraceae archaeon]
NLIVHVHDFSDNTNLRNPGPIGFGEDVISTGKVQLPFAIVLLISGSTLKSLSPSTFNVKLTDDLSSAVNILAIDLCHV